MSVLRLIGRLPKRLGQHHNLSTNGLVSCVREFQTDRRESEGFKYRGWSVLEERRVSEFDIDAVLLEHIKTKAKFLHLGCSDTNNVFSVNFRTTPTDSTGVAHILEHTTLCGSQKYPVRDPFFKMLNRSLSTFMNAMTGPDYTLYPFSTCNEQDFKNLMRVYLDSVLFPLLREVDFIQEGWRLEPEDMKDLVSPLVVKGVVFNEMKGAYSDSHYLFGQHLLNNLLPSHTYKNSSGGFPLSIPDLTWSQLKRFHASHYHPSNARFFTYGHLPLEGHLELIDAEYLARFEQLSMRTEVPAEPRWDQCRRHDLTCAPDPMSPDREKQTTVSVSYLLADIADVRESFVLQVLSELLIGGPSAPFYKSLIEPGIGAGFAPVTGYDNHTKDTTFTVGLQGISYDDTEKVLELIEKTLDSTIEEGFSTERIEAVLHSVEIGLKHKSGNFGLNLIMSMTPYWNHARNPLDYLNINETIGWFKDQMESNPRFLQDKVRQYLKLNNHKLVQTMRPSDKFVEEEKARFDELGTKLRSGLTDEDRRVIRQKCEELADSQANVEEDLSCLPSLLVRDIPTDVRHALVTHTDLAGGVQLQLSEQPTNQVSYFRAVLDTGRVPERLKPFLPVFASVLTKVGAGHLNYADLDTQADLATGGLGVSCHIAEDAKDVKKFSEGLLISSHCLDRNISKMFELWQLIFSDPHLSDLNRLNTLVKMEMADTVNGIAHSGHRYAMTAASRNLSQSSRLSEQYSGMSHVSLLSSLAAEDGAGLAAALKELAGLLLNRSNIRCALNTQPELMPALSRSLESFLLQLPGEPGTSGDAGSSQFVPSSSNDHYVVPFPVNFTSLSVPTVPYSHPDAANLRVLAALMSAKFLHPEIREKGGAYGGGAVHGGGVYSYYSYRDPNNLETFTVYSDAGKWAAEKNYTQQDVDEAILRVFQKLDEPVQPGYKGLRLFLSGIDDETFNSHRQRVREVKVEDVANVAEKYLTSSQVFGRAMLGPAQDGLANLGWNVHNQ